MKHFIKDFKHLPGKNCVTTALRNILNYYNIIMSEELVLGLAGGLGFYYKEYDDFPNPMIGGNSGNLAERFCDNMGLIYHELHKQDSEAAHKALLGKIISNIPVIVKIDLYYLDYFHSKYHFSSHRVIPVAVDDEFVFVADTGYRSIKKTSLDNFKTGRVSDYAPGSPNNHQIFFQSPEQELPVYEKLWEIIRNNAQDFLLSKNGNGLTALKTFTENADKFADLEYFHTQIEKAGTGGSLGRQMYCDFLSEAILYRPHELLVQAYELFSEVVEYYQLITEGIQKKQITDLSMLLDNIYEREKMAVEFLSELPRQ